MATGEFGTSYRDGRCGHRHHRPPSACRGPCCFGLSAYAVAAILVGVPAGIVAALRRGSALDRLIMGFAVLRLRLPNFFLGILMILLFSLTLRWLPSSGTGTDPAT